MKDLLRGHTIIYLEAGAKKLESIELSMVNITYVFRKLLLEQNYRVVLHKTFTDEQVHASAGNIRLVSEYIYPDGDFTDQNYTCRVLAVTMTEKNSQLHVIVASIDQHMRETKFCCFNDSDQLTRLESIILQLGAKEIIYDKKSRGIKQLEMLLKRTRISLEKIDFTFFFNIKNFVTIFLCLGQVLGKRAY